MVDDGEGFRVAKKTLEARDTHQLVPIYYGRLHILDTL